MNKKGLIVAMIFILSCIGAALASFSIRQNEASQDDFFVPGSVSVYLKPEYRNNKAVIEDVAKSIGGTVDYDKGVHDMGLYEIIVKTNTEDEAVASLGVKPEVETAHRSLYVRTQ